MTPQERKVLEMALEALELMYACYKNPKWVSYKQQEQKILEQTVDTITAIKEALAQPEQEPVAWRYGALLYWDKLDALEFMRTSNDGYQLEPLYTTPQPDKLAYYEKVADDLQALCDKQSLRIAELEKSWIGLNWDDLLEIYVGDKAFLHGAQWAEAKLREKNHD